GGRAPRHAGKDRRVATGRARRRERRYRPANPHIYDSRLCDRVGRLYRWRRAGRLNYTRCGDFERERAMSQRKAYVPQGVIPGVPLPFDNDLAIDEVSFGKPLRDVASVEGLSAITINAHSTEVASCTFDEQKRVLDIAQDEIGARLPL